MFNHQRAKKKEAGRYQEIFSEWRLKGLSGAFRNLCNEEEGPSCGGEFRGARTSPAKRCLQVQLPRAHQGLRQNFKPSSAVMSSPCICWSQLHLSAARPRFVPVNLPWQRYQQPLWSFLEAAKQPKIPPKPHGLPLSSSCHSEPPALQALLCIQSHPQAALPCWGQGSSSVLSGWAAEAAAKKLHVYSSLSPFPSILSPHPSSGTSDTVNFFTI